MSDETGRDPAELRGDRDDRAHERDDRAYARELRADAREASADARDNLDSAAYGHVDDLIAANMASNNTMLQLVESVRLDAEMRERKIDLLQAGLKTSHRLMVLVSVMLVVVGGLAIINAVNLNDARRNAAITAATAKDARQTYALLYDCINQQGECGKQNAKSQKVALDNIKLYELTVLYCARINPQLADPKGDDFLACVKELYPTGPNLPKKASTP